MKSAAAISRCTQISCYESPRNIAAVMPSDLPPELTRSATGDFIAFLSVGSSIGSFQKRSPAIFAAARTSSPKASLLVKRPPVLVPRATAQAPVSVAMSIILSGFSSDAKESASARVSLPSASVLLTSIVFPFLRAVCHGSVAFPPGIFSAAAIIAVTLQGSFRPAAALTAPRTAQALLLSPSSLSCNRLV